MDIKFSMYVNYFSECADSPFNSILFSL